jgi:predicted RNase H-like nuclease (RuvC/YqgF family)
MTYPIWKMDQKNSLTITLSKEQTKEVIRYCQLNDIDTDGFLVDCFNQGFLIEKNGLIGKTGGVQEKWVEKEVIVEKRVEVPVEVIKEVEKIVEVIKEVPVESIVEKVVEVVKEVPVEVVIEKEVYITDDEQVNELGGKITKLEEEKNELLLKIQQLGNEPKTDTVDKSKLLALQETIQKLQKDNREKSDKILQLEKNLLDLQSVVDKKGHFLRGSNLNDIYQ